MSQVTGSQAFEHRWARDHARLVQTGAPYRRCPEAFAKMAPGISIDLALGVARAE